jgi:hypothetical protein
MNRFGFDSCRFGCIVTEIFLGYPFCATHGPRPDRKEIERMKKTFVGATVIAAMMATATAPAFAGGLGEPAIEDELIVVEEAPAGSVSPGLVVAGLLGLALVAAVVSSDDDT